MPFAPLDDIPAVDAAFRAWGADLEEVFRSAWNAVRAVLTGDDPTAETSEVPEMREAPGDTYATRTLGLRERELDLLLLEFLQEQLYLKDAAALLCTVRALEIEPTDGEWRLSATLTELPIVELGAYGVDVKAVTLDHLGVCRTASGWEATVVLDL